jgi:tetratricopeptide (TPR) repeat protein
LSILAARELLKAPFFPALNAAQRAQVTALTEQYPVVWEQLAVMDRPASEVRGRVSLLMNVGEYATAEKWLNALPEVEISPDDGVAMAGMALAQGDVSRALAILQPATDADWRTARATWHPDRWANNKAAQTYYLLRGNIAQRDGRLQEALTAYQQAVDAGAATVGQYFMGQVASITQPLLFVGGGKGQGAQKSVITELVPLLALTDSKSLYATDAQIASPDAHSLRVSAAYGGIKPYGNPYPIQTWSIEIISPDGKTQYAAAQIPAVFVDGALMRLQADIAIPDDIAVLTRALVYIQPRYDNAITTTPLIIPVTLNLPPSVPIPAEADPANLQFGDAITLHSTLIKPSADKLDVTLYWSTKAQLSENYQVFVHVLDDAGHPVGQQDGTPVNGLYPTTQWQMGATTADSRTITFDKPLAPGAYHVWVGMYRLPDGQRLRITPADARVKDNSAQVYVWSIK